LNATVRTPGASPAISQNIRTFCRFKKIGHVKLSYVSAKLARLGLSGGYRIKTQAHPRANGPGHQIASTLPARPARPSKSWGRRLRFQGLSRPFGLLVYANLHKWLRVAQPRQITRQGRTESDLTTSQSSRRTFGEGDHFLDDDHCMRGS
jgi:hypothetical protein